MLAQLSQFPQSQWGYFHLFHKPRDTSMPCSTPTCTPKPNSSLCLTRHPPDLHLVPVLRPDYPHLWSGSLLRENLASLTFRGWGGWRRTQAFLSFKGRGFPYSSFEGQFSCSLSNLSECVSQWGLPARQKSNLALWRPGKGDVLKLVGPSPMPQPHLETLLKFYQLHIHQMLAFCSPGMCVAITIIKAF